MEMSTRAIIALVKIIRDTEHSTKTRIEACEMLLDYETRPDVMEFARQYLEAIYEWEPDPNREYTEDERWRLPTISDKLKALKLARELEAPKIRAETVVRREEPKRDTTADFIRRLDERSRQMHERADERDRFEREYEPQIAALRSKGFTEPIETLMWLFTGQGPEFVRDSALRLKAQLEAEGIDATNVLPFAPARKSETIL
jgi:hypothetical protein